MLESLSILDLALSGVKGLKVLCSALIMKNAGVANPGLYFYLQSYLFMFLPKCCSPSKDKKLQP